MKGIIERIMKMKELSDIFAETADGAKMLVCFPVRIVYWCSKNLLKILGMEQE